MLLLLLACHKTPDESPCVGGVAELEGGALRLESACGAATLSPRVIGEGSLQVELRDEGGLIVPIILGQGTFRALALEGPIEVEGEAPARLWKQGYQSWWWSGVTELEPIERDADGLPLAGGDGDGASATHETPFTSWWVGLLGRPDSGAGLLLGALSAQVTKSYVAFDDDSATLVLGGRGERIPVDGELRLDPVYGASGPVAFEVYRDYARAAAAQTGASPRPEGPQVGWATWVQFYSGVSEEDMRRNLAAAQGTPMTLMQLDDGWENAWGDWTANERFPSGMAAMAAEITEAGFTPGLWMAPFYVDEGPLTAAHPDWWVRDLDTGEPITFGNFGDHAYHIVDVTHPDAAAWMQDQIRTRVSEGWTYLKLDFLYAGAQEGLRQEDLTGAEAFQRGMALLREAAGPDTWILACGAPLLPSLGWVDSYRTGADIAFEFDPDPRLEYLRWQARATAARSWQNGLWWWNDPDQMMLRAPLTGPQVRGSIAAQFVSGGPWLLGDELEALDAEVLALSLDTELIGLSLGAVGEPLNPLSFASGPDFSPLAELGDPNDSVPSVWQVGSTTVLLNLDDREIVVDGPGGRELLTGEQAEAGPRTLEPGGGEIWLP